MSSIDFYLNEVEQRLKVKIQELEETRRRSETVQHHAETISHFVSKWDKFEIRVKDIQTEIEQLDARIDEKTAQIDSNRNFSRREEIQMTKLYEKFEKLSEDRKSKEMTLINLLEDEAKATDSSDDSS